MPVADLELLRRWSNERDASAFEEIARKYSGLVYSAAKRILRDESKAQDVTQECFLQLAKANPRAGENLGGWLHRVATNRAISEIRSENRRRSREDRFVRQTELQVNPTWSDLREEVDCAIDELDEENRWILIAYFLEKKTQEQLAEDLGISRQSVSVRLKGAVEAVRERLKDKGIVAGTVAFEEMMQLHAVESVPASLSLNLVKLAITGPGAGSAIASTAAASALWKLLLAAGIILIVGFGWFTINRAPANSGVDQVPVAAQDLSTTDEETDREDAASAGETVPQTTPEPASEVGVSQTREPTGLGLAGDSQVSGLVIDAATEEAVASVRIEIVPSEAGNPFAALTDGEGKFRITGVTPGTYSVTLSDSEYTVVSGGQTVAIGKTANDSEVELRVLRGAALNGRVYDKHDGHGIADVLINIVSTEGAAPAYSTLTDEGGEYVADGMTEGTYEVSYTPVEGYLAIVGLVSEDTRIVRVVKGELGGPADFPLSTGGGLEGRVTLGHQPLSNATFELRCYVRPARQDDQIAHRVSGVTTDSDGRYVVERVPEFTSPGLFVLRRVNPPDENVESLKQAAFIEVGEATRLDFRFTDRSARLEGRILGADGVPLTARYIAADTVYGVPQSIFQGETDDEGHFLIEGLPGTQVHFDFAIEGTTGYRTLNVSFEDGQHVRRDIVVHDTTIECEALNVPSNSELLMFELYPIEYRVPGGFDIASLNERSDTQLYKLPARGHTATIRGIEPGRYTIVAYSRSFALTADPPEGTDYESMLKESVEVLTEVTVEPGIPVEIVLDFGQDPT